MSILHDRKLQDAVAGLQVIRIRNAAFYAYHGVQDDEQNLGGKFELDVEMYGDFLPAAETDSLKKTVDYEKVYGFVRTTVLEKKYHLLEALAHVIARGLLREFFNVEVVTVRIRKPHPPVRGVIDYVEVEITEQR
jgi:7,8-dihydroneopterin aldolase/epimerase/oxygenase